ncbi:hypothetical protein ACHAXS_008865 [Conticribra weissflogii]
MAKFILATNVLLAVSAAALDIQVGNVVRHLNANDKGLSGEHRYRLLRNPRRFKQSLTFRDDSEDRDDISQKIDRANGDGNGRANDDGNVETIDLGSTEDDGGTISSEDDGQDQNNIITGSSDEDEDVDEHDYESYDDEEPECIDGQLVYSSRNLKHSHGKSGKSSKSSKSTKSTKATSKSGKTDKSGKSGGWDHGWGSPTSEPVVECTPKPTNKPVTIPPTEMVPVTDSPTKSTLTKNPTGSPIGGTYPPTRFILTKVPTGSPVAAGTTTSPTQGITTAPFIVTNNPTASPVIGATTNPTASPIQGATTNPTASPVIGATVNPTSSPVGGASLNPTVSPVQGATPTPTASPVVGATANPTSSPVAGATSDPTVSPVQGATPSPTSSPVQGATPNPTTSPVQGATPSPTLSPVQGATPEPTASPVQGQTSIPSRSVGLPTFSPTVSPAVDITITPTISPVQGVTAPPTTSSSSFPSTFPSAAPTAGSGGTGIPTSTSSPTSSGTSSGTFDFPANATYFTSFEQGDFPDASGQWATEGDAVWVLDSEVAHTGIRSIRSGVLNDGTGAQRNSNVTFTTASDFPGGILHLFILANVEIPIDDVFYFVNDVFIGNLAGNTDWQPLAIPLRPGDNTVLFSYKYNPIGLDTVPPPTSDTYVGAAYIDDVYIEGIGGGITNPPVTGGTSIPSKAPSVVSGTTPPTITPAPTTWFPTGFPTPKSNGTCTDFTSDDFESGTFPTPPWTTGGDGEWFIDTAQAFEGTYSIRSPDLEGSTTAVYSNATIVTCDNFVGGVLSAQVLASVLPPSDLFIIYIDGNSAAQLVDVQEFTEVTLGIPPGVHVIDFSYRYNFFNTDPLPPAPPERLGAVWLDNVVITPIGS